MVSYIKEGTQAKGIWKQDPEANIWAQEESGEGSTIATSLFFLSSITVYILLFLITTFVGWDTLVPSIQPGNVGFPILSVLQFMIFFIFPSTLKEIRAL